MKKIAVVEKFFEPQHQRQIEAVAAKHGYTVDYYMDGVLPEERAGEYEIVYGMPARTDLKGMTQLNGSAPALPVWTAMWTRRCIPTRACC